MGGPIGINNARSHFPERVVRERETLQRETAMPTIIDALSPALKVGASTQDIETARRATLGIVRFLEPSGLNSVVLGLTELVKDTPSLIEKSIYLELIAACSENLYNYTRCVDDQSVVNW